jgi:hypothetical protein
VLTPRGCDPRLESIAPVTTEGAAFCLSNAWAAGTAEPKVRLAADGETLLARCTGIRSALQSEIAE